MSNTQQTQTYFFGYRENFPENSGNFRNVPLNVGIFFALAASFSEILGQSILIPKSGLQPAAIIGSAGVQSRSGETGQTRSPQKRVAYRPSGFKASSEVKIPAPAHIPASLVNNSKERTKEIGFRNWSAEPDVAYRPPVTAGDVLLFKLFADFGSEDKQDSERFSEASKNYVGEHSKKEATLK